MDYIQGGLKFLMALFMFIILIRIFMKMGNYSCEKLGLEKFFLLYLWEKQDYIAFL